MGNSKKKKKKRKKKKSLHSTLSQYDADKDETDIYLDSDCIDESPIKLIKKTKPKRKKNKRNSLKMTTIRKRTNMTPRKRQRDDGTIDIVSSVPKKKEKCQKTTIEFKKE